VYAPFPDKTKRWRWWLFVKFWHIDLRRLPPVHGVSSENTQRYSKIVSDRHQMVLLRSPPLWLSNYACVRNAGKLVWPRQSQESLPVFEPKQILCLCSSIKRLAK
jgi:hypothetical protein